MTAHKNMCLLPGMVMQHCKKHDILKPMEDIFEFNEKRHFYTLNGNRLYGITSVLGVIAKPSLYQWYADLAAAKAFTFMANSDRVSEIAEEVAKHDKINTQVAKSIGEKFPEFDQARKAATSSRDSAAKSGISIHGIIEDLVKKAILETSGYIEASTHEEPQVQEFLNWANGNQIQFLMSEQRLYSKTLWLAGTMDLLFKMGGEVYVGDIKTTGGIYDRTPFMQEAGYEIMLNERYPDLQITGRCVIRIGKTGGLDVKYSTSPLDKEGFLAAFTLFKALEKPVSDTQVYIKKAKYKNKFK